MALRGEGLMNGEKPRIPDAGSPVQDVYDAAAAFRRGEVQATVFTVSIGADAETALLEYIAGDPTRHFNAPAPADLLRIYRGIAGALPCD